MPTWKYNANKTSRKQFVVDGKITVLTGGDTIESKTFSDHAAQGLTKTSDEPITRRANAEHLVENEAGAGGKVTQEIGAGIASVRIRVVSGGPVNVYRQNATGNSGLPEMTWLEDETVWSMDINDECSSLVFEFEGGNGSVKMVTYVA